MNLAKAIHALSTWFAARGISTDSLTLILNVSDRDAAAHLDWCLKHEFEKLQMHLSPTQIDIRKFELMGIKVQVESPLHEPIT